MPKNIFTHILNTPGNLVHALCVTLLSEETKIPVLTFYSRDTQMCKDPNPNDPWVNAYLKRTYPPEGKQIANFAMSAVFALVDYFHYCSTEQSHWPKSIEQESVMHDKVHLEPLSGPVAQNNTHVHWAFPELTPEILQCILEQIGIAQNNHGGRNQYIQHPEISGRTLKNLKEMRCANNPTPNFDTMSPLIHESEFLDIVNAYTRFYEQQPAETIADSQNRKAYLNRYFSTNIPLYIRNQIHYFRHSLENAISASFWTSGILSLTESILKECTSLEPRQLANITNDLYLYLLASNPDAGILPYIVLATCRYLSPRQTFLMALSLNVSLEVLENTEHEEMGIGGLSLIGAGATSALLASVTAAITSGVTRSTISYGSGLLKRGISYFYPSKTEISRDISKNLQPMSASAI